MSLVRVKDEDAAASSSSVTTISTSITPWLHQPPPMINSSEDRGVCIVHLLFSCAAHVSALSFGPATALLDRISLLSSPDGDTMQRIASFFSDALARRLLLRPFPGLYRALSPAPLPAADLAVARSLFLHLCPFLRLAFSLSNQSILDSIMHVDDVRAIHLVDLHAADPSQHLALMHSLSGRPGGPPGLRITGFHCHRDILFHVASVLSAQAAILRIPFQFTAVVADPTIDTLGNLDVKPGEALAITSALQLHSLLSTPARMEAFLAHIRGLSPRIMVITEQEADHNAATVYERFTEALNYYSALFDCLESTGRGQSSERARVEKMLFGEEIRDIIACEGPERRERHERLGKWVRRMETAGFRRVPMSGGHGLVQANRMLQQEHYTCSGDAYRVKEESGCFLLCWQDRPMFSVSSWSACMH